MFEAIRTYPGEVLKGGKEDKSFQWAKFLALDIVSHFTWKGTCPDIQIYMNSWAVVNNLAEW